MVGRGRDHSFQGRGRGEVCRIRNGLQQTPRASAQGTGQEEEPLAQQRPAHAVGGGGALRSDPSGSEPSPLSSRSWTLMPPTTHPRRRIGTHPSGSAEEGVRRRTDECRRRRRRHGAHRPRLLPLSRRWSRASPRPSIVDAVDLRVISLDTEQKSDQPHTEERTYRATNGTTRANLPTG